MRYRVRTLLIFATLMPPLLAALIWVIIANSFPEIRDRPRDSHARKATNDVRKLFESATELKIIDAGDAFTFRSKSFHAEVLKRLAKVAVISEVEVSNVPESIVANGYVRFQLQKGDKVLQEYMYLYSNSLVDASPKNNPAGYWTKLKMSEAFDREFRNELTTVR
jgi:hypothetical protein